MTGADYGPAVLNGISTRYEPEDIYAGALWGALQALDAGITRGESPMCNRCAT
jgi:hypothetical protein